MKKKYLKLIYILLTSIFLIYGEDIKPHNNIKLGEQKQLNEIIKKELGIDGVDLNKIDVKKIIEENEITLKNVKECAGAVFKILKSVKNQSNIKVLDIINYDGEDVQKDVYLNSKKFLMSYVESDISTSKGLAIYALAILFSKDKEVEEWAFSNYFIKKSSESINEYLFIRLIICGNYSRDLSSILLKNALYSGKFNAIIDIIEAVYDNPKYFYLFEDLLNLMLMIDNNEINIKHFDKEIYDIMMGKCMIKHRDTLLKYFIIIRPVLKKNKYHKALLNKLIKLNEKQ